MADERKIVIEIKGTGGDGSQSPKPGEPSEPNAAAIINMAFHPIQTIEKNTIGRNAFVSYVFHNAVNQAKGIIRYEVTKNFRLAEDYNAENTMENVLNAFSTIGGMGSSIVAGAMAGNTFGPIGALAGAMVGFSISVASNAITANQRREQDDIKINEQNMQNAFKRKRLGLSNGGRGTEN